MRGPVLALLTCLPIGLARADEPTVESGIRAQLVSKDPVEVAWGLHHAVETGLPGADDLVRRVLREWTGDGSETRAVRTAAIDAVLELDVRLPDDLLRATARDTGVPRQLLLAARKPTACRDLLRDILVGDVEDDAWTAACNLLAPLRDAVLAAHLLSLLRLEANVTVRDPGPEPRFVGRGRGVRGFFGVGCGQVEILRLTGWPPRFRWDLSSTPRTGARLVARGRTPIYAFRRRLETGDFVCSQAPCEWLRARSATELLADLLGSDVDELRSSLTEFATVELTDAAAWNRRTAELETALRRVWSDLLARCRGAGLITVEQALALPPRIELVVDDARSTKHPPLPVPAADEPARK